jgi:hypothetical protein
MAYAVGRAEARPYTESRYSSRRVRMGSTRVARYAGTTVARMPTMTRRTATVAKVSGSVGRTP